MKKHKSYNEENAVNIYRAVEKTLINIQMKEILKRTLNSLPLNIQKLQFHIISNRDFCKIARSRKFLRKSLTFPNSQLEAKELLRLQAYMSRPLN